MNQPPDSARTRERRRSERVPGPDLVTVRIPEISLSGTSENMSVDGLYLTLEDEIPVEIRMADGSVETRTGKIVRIDHLRQGQSGVAIRFT